MVDKRDGALSFSVKARNVSVSRRWRIRSALRTQSAFPVACRNLTSSFGNLICSSCRPATKGFRTRSWKRWRSDSR